MFVFERKSPKHHHRISDTLDDSDKDFFLRCGPDTLLEGCHHIANMMIDSRISSII
ncbi:hypothetical protein SY212_23680 [Ligilactobacillus agilis]|uniref:Uncharacterized protein n=1 Tax=Ligilactobacillus agilis TaxID=1601 RepID=A0A6F9XQ76_9LACO|nr:hypothetical protein SY212_23680 [Ligilactobacillus agilis]GET13689.1 hypothetical protein SN811_21890 [Ligilactobacillus agilis]